MSEQTQTQHHVRERVDLVLWALIAASIGLRLVGLGHLPGINGDEAYLGTKVVLFLRGEDISLLTGTSLPPDPISFLLSALLHALGPISFVTLRLPSVISGALAALLP